MKTLFINGRFLTQPLTGTQRFAREIVFALDKILNTKKNNLKVTLIAPQGTQEPKGLQNISFKTVGTHQGHLWEQWDLYKATRRGKLLNFVNSGPALHHNQFVVIHDVMVYRFPQNYSLPYRLWHRTIGKLISYRAQIGTVSNFSQSELADVLGIDKEKITVIPNGSEHIATAAPDDKILKRLNLQERDYFLFVGSPSPNKNLKRAIEAFTALKDPSLSFVIVGAAGKIFQAKKTALPASVIMSGRLTDEEIVALYSHAKALIFPSLYEGFGIPPLEAMVHGCPVLASDIPPVQEVCQDAALYFNPYNVEDMRAKMNDFLTTPTLAETLKEKGTKRYKSFSWSKSAEDFRSLLNKQ